MRSLDGRWDDLVIICSTQVWRDIPVVEMQLARRLATRTPVLFVDPAASPLHGGQLRPRLEQRSPRLAVLRTPGLPGPNRPVVRDVVHRMVVRSVRHAVRALGSPRVRAMVVARPPGPFGAVETDRTVSLVTDDFVAGASLMGVDRGYLERSVEQMAARSDVVLAVSEPLADQWRLLAPHAEIGLLPNGVDVDLYQDVDRLARPDDIELPDPLVGCVGQLNRRLDPKLLDEIADRGRSVLLIGPLTSSTDRTWFDAFVARPNVQWLGAKPHDELPAYLGALTVGVVPYTQSPFNQASFPLKTLEYLAAGRAAVSTDLPAVRWIDSPLIVTGDSPADFADRVEEELARPQTPELVRARRALATEHSWDARAASLAAVLGLDDAPREDLK